MYANLKFGSIQLEISGEKANAFFCLSACTVDHQIILV